MKSLAEQMAFYHEYHSKTVTKLTHVIGIPLAILPVLMLLNWLGLSINGLCIIPLSWFAIAVLSAYYFYLDWQLACFMLVGLLALNGIAIALTGLHASGHGFLIMLLVFIIAWAIQFIGHAFEGKRPALFDNFFQVLIAPIFIAAEIAFALGRRKDLEAKMRQYLK